MLSGFAMLRLVEASAYSQMARLLGDALEFESTVYDSRYIHRLSFAAQGTGGGLLEIFVSEDAQQWVQFGRYEFLNSISIENQLCYMPRFVKVVFHRQSEENPMLCAVQISPLVPEISTEFGVLDHA